MYCIIIVCSLFVPSHVVRGTLGLTSKRIRSLLDWLLPQHRQRINLMICGYILRKMDMYRNGVITNILRRESNLHVRLALLALRFTEEFFHRTDPTLTPCSKAGVTVFRMGIDWGRLVTKHKICLEARVQNVTALNRYRNRGESQASGNATNGQSFHHSIPSWASQIGGWSNTTLKSYFAEFARDV